MIAAGRRSKWRWTAFVDLLLGDLAGAEGVDATDTGSATPIA